MKTSRSAWRAVTPLLLLLSLAGCLAHPARPAQPAATPFSALSPSGHELLTAASDAATTRLLRTATANGATLAELTIPGRCEGVLARPGEWLIFVSRLESYRFGGNLRSGLLRWDGVHPPTESLLNDTTLDRSTLLLKDQLLRTLQPQLSPYGDELLLARLHDPPAFDLYLEIVLYHLDSQQFHSVAKVPGLQVRADYRQDGDLVAIRDGQAAEKLVDPWGRERVVIAADEAGTPPRLTEKILLLRKWRAIGLITPQEYSDKVREGQE